MKQLMQRNLIQPATIEVCPAVPRGRPATSPASWPIRQLRILGAAWGCAVGCSLSKLHNIRSFFCFRQL